MRKMLKMHEMIENPDFADLSDLVLHTFQIPPKEAINTNHLPHKTYDYHTTLIGFVAAHQAHPV